jgi:hypothetical protein
MGNRILKTLSVTIYLTETEYERSLDDKNLVCRLAHSVFDIGGGEMAERPVDYKGRS